MEANLPNRVVVPTYNEADNLEPLTAAVFAAAPNGTGILVVDDASPDGTGELADELAAGDERITVLHRAGKEGLGPAYVAGHQRALALGAERVVQMDADFSHDPADVPRLIAAAEGEGGADLVLGSRYVAGGGIGDWGVGRQAISRWGSTYARFWLGISIRDLTGGFKCFRREVLEAIHLETVGALGYAFQVETTYRACLAGFRVVEIPIVFKDRRVGESKMSRSIVAEAALRVPMMRLRGRRWS
ncbi:MAG: polyprenol monophosphomannose synthase [Solirubrobacterales bacterium]|nr:polyprenol monophosphomannose synthase [Solirubrobacterales bacterium]MCO5326284.1 polyprenol monophosphomannose synthase [Solirubrobacterales bacterium]